MLRRRSRLLTISVVPVSAGPGPPIEARRGQRACRGDGMAGPAISDDLASHHGARCMPIRCRGLLLLLDPRLPYTSRS